MGKTFGLANFLALTCKFPRMKSEWVSEWVFFCSFVAFHPAYQLRGCALTTEESFSRLCRWTCIFCRKSSNARGAIATTTTTIFYYYHHFFLLSPEAIVHFLPTCSSFLGWFFFMHLNIRLIVVCVCVWMCVNVCECAVDCCVCVCVNAHKEPGFRFGKAIIAWSTLRWIKQ